MFKINYFYLIIAIFILTSCKKDDHQSTIQDDSVIMNTSNATIPCNSGLLINGCFENDSMNFNIQAINFHKFKFKHKNRDFIRLVNGTGTQSFTLASEQIFAPGTYDVEIRIPKSGLSFACDFAIRIRDTISGVPYESYLVLNSYPFSAQIDTASTVQFINHQFTVDSYTAGFDVVFILTASGNYGFGLVSKIDYIEIIAAPI